MTSRLARAFGAYLGAALCLVGSVRASETVLVQAGSSMRYLANKSDPLLGLAWIDPNFNDGSWTAGTYGVGYEMIPPGAVNLIDTPIPARAYSIYTRAKFNVSDRASVFSLRLGADYDDGYVAWLNGVEVYRSPEIPAGPPAWNTNSAQHESSNGASPDYGTLIDISAAGLPALRSGENVLAVGLWNGLAVISADLVVVPYLSSNSQFTPTRGPYLQLGTPTGIVVRWRTAVASDSRVRYGPAPGSLTSFADGSGVTTEHVVALSGLSPATRYYYSVGTSTGPEEGGDANHYFVTSPPPGSAAPARIWVVGDSGTANASARAVRDAYETLTGTAHTDYWLMLGDNAYPTGTDDQYQAAVFDTYPELLRKSVLWPTLGNHDGASADSTTQSGPYYDIFTLPTQAEAGGIPSGTEAYYSFDAGNIHFICLDSFDTDRSPGGAMMTWLQEDVMATTRDWVVAFWHHPPYTKGSHDSDFEGDLIQMRTNALPILEAAGVDLVLTGHSHSYERSFLIDGHYGSSNTFTPAMQIDPGDGRIDGTGAYAKPAGPPGPHAGAVYVVAGSSGQTSGGSLNHPAMFVSLNVLGSLVLEVNGPQLDAKFLDDAGAWQDYFTLYKGAGSPPNASFIGQPRKGAAPLSVTFTDTSTNGAAARSWDFDNDGGSDSGLTAPTHPYSQPGFHSVRLTAFSAPGSDEEIKPDYVCVSSSGGVGDTDGDGIPDASDPCPCALLPPGEIGETLALGPSTAAISWVRDSAAVLTNLYRGTIPAGAPFSYTHACLLAATAGQTATDAATPPLGGLFYYLAGSTNGCGDGLIGRNSAGTPLPNPAPCP
ncbi:MAG TPA: metallophosphoesterase [Candidatus Polarisedimenticolia bacterium]|nr:metallophosphoesterase [Candidatus Polarisedimenticolia bacterium]